MARTPFFVLLSFLLVAPSKAATWVDIGGNDEVTVFIDSDSVRRTGNRVKTWLRWQWTKPQEVPNAYPAKSYLLEKQLQISDCRDGTLAIAQGVQYADLAGSDVVHSYTVPERAWRFSEAVPETLGANILKYACRVPNAKRAP